ncbi:MAG: hypothetical protein OEY11_01645 [Gammaproteobacteria bacterium]|nr:hypothetical protein [Gammaproteobacteria bacterium]
MLKKYWIVGLGWYLCLGLSVIMALSSCGKSGKLYLPDEKVTSINKQQ